MCRFLRACVERSVVYRIRVVKRGAATTAKEVAPIMRVFSFILLDCCSVFRCVENTTYLNVYLVHVPAGHGIVDELDTE